jgi:hypothetical protein
VMAQADGSEVLAPTRVPNKQLLMYADGCIEKFGLRDSVKEITSIIVQPRLNHICQFSITTETAKTHLDFLRFKADETRTNPKFVPSGSNCKWCKASGNCKPQTQLVYETALQGFDDESMEALDTNQVDGVALGIAYSRLNLISGWMSAVSGRVYNELSMGRRVVGEDGVAFKLVQGKAGKRNWSDEAQAEATLQLLGLTENDIYKRTLVSPTSIEKLSKTVRPRGKDIVYAKISEQHWGDLQSVITRPESKDVIALETDPRESIASGKQKAVEGFDFN